MTDQNIGKKLGNYLIESFIAEGGMSHVYKGKHERFERRYAIKVLKPELTIQSSIRWRFENEAKVMDKLSECRDIINVYDFYEEGSFLAIIMEYLEGETLKDRIKKGAMSGSAIKEIFPRILDAFQYAHDKNTVHRDVKPSNIYLLSNGEIRVLDFGIAKIVDSNENLTVPGTQMGTTNYMSPEQVLDSKNLDLRSDIYSLGVTLYHCLIGKSPYNTDTISRFEIQRKIVDEPLPELEKLQEPYRSIIEKCTAKQPENRYRSCEEIKLAIIGKQTEIPSEDQLWKNARKQNTEYYYRDYLRLYPYPAGKYSAEANNRIVLLQKQAGSTNEDKTELEGLVPPIATPPKTQLEPEVQQKKKSPFLWIVGIAALLIFIILMVWRPWVTNNFIENTIVPIADTAITVANLPYVETLDIGNITEKSATASGNVRLDSTSVISERGICYGIKESPTTSDNKLVSGNGFGSFTANLSNLQNNTTYYVRAYAINKVGTTYGEEKSFKTILKTVLPKFGSYTDSRDGKTYKTVKIGNQVWMAENLNYYTSSGSWCYADNNSNCNKYGRLYDWETAQKVCPAGWHLPSKSEFNTLLNNCGGSGTNAYKALIEGGNSGFSALLGGWRYGSGGFNCIGSNGGWWSSSEYNTNLAWSMDICTYNQPAGMDYNDKEWGLSVRCLKD